MHLPVLLNEVIDNLCLWPGKCVLDATCGGGGHSRAILEKIMPGGKLIAVDKDPEAVERTREVLKDFAPSIVFVNGDFRDVAAIITEAGEESIDGAVFDLGFSSYQIDDPGRGFSYAKDGTLDMRFDRTAGKSAFDMVNRYGEEELYQIIRTYGEERHSRLVARAICEHRRKDPVNTTAELARIVTKAVGKKYRKQRIHPAARTFQALRIAVNDELSSVDAGIKDAVSKLKKNGRICVISFHSLEDRIVKNIFRAMRDEGRVTLVFKKVIKPSDKEKRINPRARSAKLRVAERN